MTIVRGVPSEDAVEQRDFESATICGMPQYLMSYKFNDTVQSGGKTAISDRSFLVVELFNYSAEQYAKNATELFYCNTVKIEVIWSHIGDRSIVH